MTYTTKQENKNMLEISRRTMQIESDYEVMAVAKEARAKENQKEKRRNTL